MENTRMKTAASLFEMKGIPEIGKVVPLGLQHVVAAIVGVVTPALIVAQACGISGEGERILVQMALVISALTTLLQLFPVFRIGAGLPVIMGVSFAYIPTLKSIGEMYRDSSAAAGYNSILVIFGAQIVGGIVAVIFGLFLKRVRIFFPPLVTGTVIFTIGLSLYPTAVRYMAGGVESAPDFGAPKQWIVALLTLAVVVFFNFFTKGSLKLASILIGMTAGYLLALALGMVSFDKVGQSGWIQVISPLYFGVPKFIAPACVSMAVMFVVNSVQAIGDFSSTTIGAMDREPTDKELSGGIIANGVSSIAGAFCGGLPVATYSQNVGIVTVNRVVNKMIFAFAALVLLIAGLVPKFAAILTTIPQCVIGGATISVFATITMTGIKMITSAKMTPRNTTVVGLSVALGVGVTQVANCLQGFPGSISSIFSGSSVVIATLAAILLNLILPKEKG